MDYDLKRVAFLIVDDNTTMRRLVRSLLQAFGAEDVQEARDGTAAFEHMQARSPDIIITDFVMQPMDGVTFTRKLRRYPASADPFVPIIMMTGYAERDRVIEARDAGVTEIVVKPLTASSLYARLVAVIERPRPFVRVERYFGPDRRRRQETYSGSERRIAIPVALPTAASGGDASEIEWS